MSRKSLVTILAFLFIAGLQPARAEEPHKLIVFFSPSCHRCQEAKEKVLPRIEREFEGKIVVEWRDISDLEHYKSFLLLRDKYHSQVEFYTPMFYMDGAFVNGKHDMLGDLRKLISASLGKGGLKEEIADVDLIKKFKSFTLLAIVGAGLTDGINPCAFTVIVFFISFLALQGYRKRELVAIGITFIFAVFLTYLLIGLGLFNFIYALKGFWLATRVINILIGTLSIVLAGLCIYDLYKYKASGSTEDMLLKLPKPVKDRIHAVIGMHYRKDKNGFSKRHILSLALTALATGFLVSILEAVCTGQLYIPTIAFIIKTSNLKIQALVYLLVYNLMFVLPLFIIFLFALLGATSNEFAAFMKRHIPSIKILMAAVFLGLGLFLIWRM
jgi:cytochrome c biogenesis protein CcdA